MAQIINLRRAKKRKQREERDKEAQDNRLLHSVSNQNKHKHRHAALKAEKELDGHRLDRDNDRH